MTTNTSEAPPDVTPESIPRAVTSRGRACLRSLAIGFSLTTALVAIGIVALVLYELRTSRIQSKVLARIAREITFELGRGETTAIRFPDTGPYDLRLGYAKLPGFIDSLKTDGFAVTAQARSSPRFLSALDRGMFPVYHEKTRAGLTVLDRDDRPIFTALCPERAYASFDSIPPLVVQSLLFVENRELLDDRNPRKNPVVEWDRLAKAAFDWTWEKVNTKHQVPGGSTLATQIEKYRHSPEGMTASPAEKMRQMASASLRAYLEGEETLEARRRIVLDYLNSTPLSARPGFGEVIGIGDGLWAWYGADFAELNRLLADLPSGPPRRDDSTVKEPPEFLIAAPAARVTDENAIAYKQALSLLLVARRPSYYLLNNRDRLETLTNSYLRLARKEQIISQELCDRALALPLTFSRAAPSPPEISFVERKAANAIRNRTRGLLGVERLYDLDRLDLSVKSTLASSAQQDVTAVLRDLSDPNTELCRSLRASGVLSGPDPSKMIYSFTLYERGADANLLRIQSDNIDQPFDLNEGAKLELGSTAKLRTLVTYLEIMANLHARYATTSGESLDAMVIAPNDHLSRWAINYLLNSEDDDLTKMLEAAMQRTYSASPDEEFFTGGGLHTFDNFDPIEDDIIYTVSGAFHHSVNLSFIRIMRDIVRHTQYQTPGSSARVLEEPDDPKRRELLEKFADREGRQFLDRFYKKYKDKSGDDAYEDLLSSTRRTPKRLTAFFATVMPDSGFDAYLGFMRERLPSSSLSDEELRALFDTHSASVMSLADRGYVAGVHPLELWIVGFLRDNPGATRTRVIEASLQERIDTYEWLYKTSRKNAQDSKIRAMLEVEAFLEIHRMWQRLGYPFDSLVPSYATSIGSSGDRPAALSELLGIILSDGVRRPTVRIRELHFASDTPFETIMQPAATQPGAAAPEQVLAPEVARVVRETLLGVVEKGTARRVYGAFKDSEGEMIPVGGKTGTGDNRYSVYGRQGQLISSRAVSRVATFVFTIGDRFFGAITAYVPGQEADRYKFTSTLPVEVLKRLAPALEPLIERPEGERLE
ncbi:MAG: transglycosylase domain-containing protein [bacterium]